MKKVLFFAVSAMFCLAACNKSEVVYDTQPQEISLLAVNKVATKAAVETAEFPTGWTMKVAAYLAAGDGVDAGRDYFTGTNFAKNGTYWTGGKYWPISAATLNFLAVAPEVTGKVVTNATSAASSSTTTVTGNEVYATQYDVMYAVGRGSKDAGTAPSAGVDMVFKHAYCLLDFWFKTTLTPAPTIIINSITVNDVACNGTLTVTPANANSPSETLSANHTWSGYTPDTDIVVPTDGNTFTLNTTLTRYNKGLMLIPNDPMASFTINYTIDGQEFDYVYTPTPAVTWDAGTKYTYNITMTPALIQVNPSVTTWSPASLPGVDLN